jgi:hypothetical protein
MSSLRFNPSKRWDNHVGNNNYLGISQLIIEVFNTLREGSNLKMLEIGSYNGESTSMFASSGIFDEIHCIEPFNENCETVVDEFSVNIRYFNNIILHKDYSYNICNKFPDKYFDFIYINTNHKYEDIKQDILMYLPKTKYLIGGHNYQTNSRGVVMAVNEIFNTPHKTYMDGSWVHSIR